MVDWTAISAIASAVRTVHEIFRDIPSKDRTPPPELVALPPEPPSNNPQPERYQVGLGRRHKFLRENILKLNPREMADLYGFERVAYLEDCEAGLDEFPTAAIQRLVQVFFVAPQYLQGEWKSPFFQSFRIIDSREDCRCFLEEEFRPVFLCGPDFQKNGYAYLVFSKFDQGYWRMIRSDTIGGFHSMGGGRSNIENLIFPMLNLKRRPSAVNMLNVDQKEWKDLQHRRWYNKGMHGYDGTVNIEAEDIFERWYKEAEALPEQQHMP